MSAENIKLTTVVRLSRVPFGRTNKYFIKLHGIDIRISRDLYRQIRSVELDRV